MVLTTTPKPEPMAILEVEGVTFAYHHQPVIEAVDLALDHGEFVALVGPNGSGKSTLIRVILGLLHPQAGRVRLFGEDPGSVGDRGRLGYVPQRPALATGLGATVEDIVAAGRLTRGGWWRRRDRDALDRALDAVGLTELRRERVASLSGGQQQRTFIARALAGEPELLVLDEPIAGVDAESQHRFRASLVHFIEQGAAVLLVSHELGAVADDLDRIVVLKRSVRFDGPPSELAAAGVSLGVHAEDLPLWLEAIR